MSAVRVDITEVQTSSTLIYDPKDDDFAVRLTVQNLGPNAIYIGPTGVATGTGYKILSAASYTLEEGTTARLYAIADTASQTSPADTRVLVEPLN